MKYPNNDERHSDTMAYGVAEKDMSTEAVEERERSIREKIEAMSDAELEQFASKVLRGTPPQKAVRPARRRIRTK